ncbi:MAG: hypothetical protein JKX98_02610 [Alcanivoracaceae bacterium]|nr:hypothetical protein [Alcanivoracaceae bacterium]
MLTFKKKIFILFTLLPVIGLSQPYSNNPQFNNQFDQPFRGTDVDCGSEFSNITNCGFETGDFTGWVATDLSAPFTPIGVVVGGMDPGFGFFITAPTEGTFAAFNGFDGDGPGVIELAQDIIVPVRAGSLTFDYRGAWDLSSFGATVDRTFDVQIQPSGGGAALKTKTILTAPVGNITNDTGNLSGTVDISSFAGQSVRIAFVWNIPENFVGPGAFQLDNVAIHAIKIIPSLSVIGIIIMFMVLMIIGTYILRRRHII